MDIVDSCKKLIQQRLSELDSDSPTEEPSELGPIGTKDRDNNLDKILRQQTHLKRMIDLDSHIQTLKSSIMRVSIDVEELRKQCTKINEDALKTRQSTVEVQAKEIDKFQLAQMRSIAEDYERHQQILELRKKEIQSLKREIEREESERDSYLADVERKLEKRLQDRRRAMRAGGLPFNNLTPDGDNGLTDELHNPDHVELTSIDEYAPYGPAPHSRIRGRGSALKAATTGGRGRGRRKRGV